MGTVTPIDTATNTPGTPIPVGPGNQAFSLAITPNGKTVYVANPFADSVIAINTDTRAVTAIPMGATSFGLAVTPNGRSLYVANASANTVTVINTTTHMVETSITVPGTPIHYWSGHCTGTQPLFQRVSSLDCDFDGLDNTD